jgi:AcrR family transcriptional regulator
MSVDKKTEQKSKVDKKSEQKKKILDAASAVVLNDGVMGLTLERVAKEAGISKGGLLHYFPNKESILQAMIERVIEEFESAVQNRIANDPVSKGSFIRAFLAEAAPALDQGSFHERRKRMRSSMVAAVALDQRLIDPVRERYQVYQEKIENDGIDPVDATIIRLVTDGIWLTGLFNFPAVSSDMLDTIFKRLQDISCGKKRF